MKKIIAALFTALLVFTPIGNVVFDDDTQIVEAKKYRSGTKSFKSDSGTTNKNPSFFQNKKEDTKSSVTKNPATNQKSSGGFWKGLVAGGLAGLLFGSLFANMGILGSILGFLVNVFAIVILVALIAKVFSYFSNKKKKEEPNPWQG